MDRRTFLETVCKTSAGIMVGGAALNVLDLKTIIASPRVSLTTPAMHEIPIMLKDTPDLIPVGGAYHLEVEQLDKDILVVHVEKDVYKAINLKCTHKACDLGYDTENKQYKCPCHDSVFNFEGKVTGGPAKKDGTVYRAELKGEEVIIYVPDEGDVVPASSQGSVPPPAPPTNAIPVSTPSAVDSSKK